MCEFVSWIEKRELVKGKPKLYYLTGTQIFQTEKGKELQKWCKSKDDLVGHGAIRYFYGLESDEGTNQECTDFTKPLNFPRAIVKAIKDGEMRELGTPQGLLLKPKWDAIDKEYQTKWDAIYKEYQTKRDAIDKEYQLAFWDLFAIKENRAEAWR
jgi:hypothetical protein